MARLVALASGQRPAASGQPAATSALGKRIAFWLSTYRQAYFLCWQPSMASLAAFYRWPQAPVYTPAPAGASVTVNPDLDFDFDFRELDPDSLSNLENLEYQILRLSLSLRRTTHCCAIAAGIPRFQLAGSQLTAAPPLV